MARMSEFAPASPPMVDLSKDFARRKSDRSDTRRKSPDFSKTQSLLHEDRRRSTAMQSLLRTWQPPARGGSPGSKHGSKRASKASLRSTQEKDGIENEESGEEFSPSGSPDMDDYEEKDPVLKGFFVRYLSDLREGDKLMQLEDLMRLLRRRSMLCTWLTPTRVKVWFAAATDTTSSVTDGTEGITYQQFEDFLQWSADLKGLKFEDCCGIICQTTGACDPAASIERKLQVLFQACGSYEIQDKMTIYEFCGVCRRWDLFAHNQLCIADIYVIFEQLGADGAVDFEGFVKCLEEVGQKIGPVGEPPATLKEWLAEEAVRLDVEQVRKEGPARLLGSHWDPPDEEALRPVTYEVNITTQQYRIVPTSKDRIVG